MQEFRSGGDVHGAKGLGGLREQHHPMQVMYGRRARVNVDDTQGWRTQMSSVDSSIETAPGSPPVKPGEMRLEVVVLPVSDVDRAKPFDESLGWRPTPTSPSTTDTG